MKSELILKHPLYQFCMEQNNLYEKSRSFCHHDQEHNDTVAKICIKLCAEWNLNINRDIIYAASYLHDTGRYLQYKSGLSHEIESSKIAYVILKDTGFTKPEITKIQEAILSHRNKSDRTEEKSFQNALGQADKLSRHCYSCSAIDQCNWPDKLKNKVRREW